MHTPIEPAAPQINSPLCQFITIHSLPLCSLTTLCKLCILYPAKYFLSILTLINIPHSPTNIRDITFSAESSPGSTGSPPSCSSYAHPPASSSVAKCSTASTFWDASQTHSPSPGPTTITHTSTHSTSCCAASKASTPTHSDSCRDLPSACA